MARGAHQRRGSQRRPARPRIPLAPMLPARGGDEGLGGPDEDFLFSALPDGWRCLAVLDDRVRLRSRSGRDLAPELPGLVAALAEMRPRGRGVGPTVLDGVLVLPPEDAVRLPAASDVTAFAAVDVLCVAGRDVTGLALRERLGMLRALPWLDPGARCLDAWRGTLAASLAQVEPSASAPLAVLARRAGSPYRPGWRHRDWLAFGGRPLLDALLCGIASSGALLLGSPTPHGLVFAGVTRPTRLWRELAPRCREALPRFPVPRLWSSLGEIAWAEPDLWVAVEPDARAGAGRGGPAYRFCRVQEDLSSPPRGDGSPRGAGEPAA